METPKIICPSCVQSCDEDAHFCPHCRSPISPYASTGPFESTFAEGAAYRAAIARPTRLIVVVGIWMIFLPMGVYGFMAIAMFMEHHHSAGFADVEVEDFFILISGLLAVPLAVCALYQITRNFLNRERREEESYEAEDPLSEEEFKDE